MDLKQFQKIRLVLVALTAMAASLAITSNSPILALVAVLTGILLLTLVKSRVKEVLIDERVLLISGQAARAAYILTVTTLGFSSLIIIVLAHQEPFLESLGIILSYLTIFVAAAYSLSYYFFHKKLSGKDDK